MKRVKKYSVRLLCHDHQKSYVKIVSVVAESPEEAKVKAGSGSCVPMNAVELA